MPEASSSPGLSPSSSPAPAPARSPARPPSLLKDAQRHCCPNCWSPLAARQTFCYLHGEAKSPFRLKIPSDWTPFGGRPGQTAQPRPTDRPDGLPACTPRRASQPARGLQARGTALGPRSHPLASHSDAPTNTRGAGGSPGLRGLGSPGLPGSGSPLSPPQALCPGHGVPAAPSHGKAAIEEAVPSERRLGRRMGTARLAAPRGRCNASSAASALVPLDLLTGQQKMQLGKGNYKAS